MLPYKPGNFDYALDIADSMADSESDLETDRLELALDTLSGRHCSVESSLKSKDYCSEFCEVCLSPFYSAVCRVAVCLLLTLLASQLTLASRLALIMQLCS